MAAGDLKGQECICIIGTLGDTVTKGQVVHFESDDGKWDKVRTGDTGPFGVALESGVNTGEVALCIYGRVETNISGHPLMGSHVIPASTGYAQSPINAYAHTNKSYVVIGRVTETVSHGVTAGGRLATVYVGLM